MASGGALLSQATTETVFRLCPSARLSIPIRVKYKSLLLFGAPGSGKGTQGKILGTVPGFFHVSCGDVFRSIDLRSPIGNAFLEYSSRGELVPDQMAIDMWAEQIQKQVALGRFKPEIDSLVLDGIPRNVPQAEMLMERLDVRRVFHLSCPDRAKLVERLKKRALRDNRLDDINEDVITQRLKTYDHETKPVLDFYGEKLVTTVDATQWPYQVLRNILNILDEHDFTH
jgi:adenylate kinase